MSYILDALKRADAERGNQQAPELPGSSFAPAPHQPPRSARAWYGIAAMLLVIAGAIVFVSRSPEAVESVVAEPKPELSAPAETVVIAAPPASLPTPATSMATPAPTVPPQDPPRPLASVPLPTANVASAAPSTAPPTIDVLAAGPSTSPTLPALAPEAPPAQSPTAEPTNETMPLAPGALPNQNPVSPAANASPRQILKRIPLPPAPTANSANPTPPKIAVAARPALPTAAAQPPAAASITHAGHPEIVITGTSYSTNPAHRMLIVNGQVVKEGQEASPGLTLESIGQRTAVFNQGGSRFNVNY